MVATKQTLIERIYPRTLAVLSLIGFIASFVLTLEKFAILKNPSHHLSCSINPLLSCGPIITSPEASAFGFPNPLIGVFAFGVLFAVAMTMLAGSVVKKEATWYWALYVIGHLFGLGLVFWLIHEAVYEIKALCIYCIVAWAVTFGLNWYGFLWLSITKRIRIPKKLERFRDWGAKNHVGVLLLSYIFVFFLIVMQFRDYFETLVR